MVIDGGWERSKFLVLNVAAELLILLLRIREILGSNLGPETGSPD
jgi:hypothetical protein